MANIMDYIDWRGDLTIENDPINEVDNLVFSWFSYVNLDDVMPNGVYQVSSTIGELGEAYFEKHTVEERMREVSFTKTSSLLFYKMYKCKRYSRMKVCNYVNKVDEDYQQQFSAMTIQIDDNNIYVVYRGTDDTIVGWKEDFNMGFMPQVPSQLEAVRYLEQSVRGMSGNIILGGHSKGGILQSMQVFFATIV